MEREQEIKKLVNVLRQTARIAFQSEWTGAGKGAAAFCVERYNRILSRLTELEPGAANVFEPLPGEVTIAVAAMACRQLAAYFEDEAGGAAGWARAYGIACDPEGFKEFWRKSARDIQDLGECMRESIEEWARRRRERARGQEAAPDKG
jgi:hypothetical protein